MTESAAIEAGVYLERRDVGFLNSCRIFNSSGDSPPNPRPETGKARINRIRLFHMLVVDDDLIFGRNFSAILKDKGYLVDLVHTGKAALERVKAEDFDIVFLDVKLPDIDGIEVLKGIKAISPRSKVIMITAFDFDSVINAANREGVAAYFCKPFNISLVLQAIEEFTR